MGSPTAAHCRELYTWCRSQRLAAGVPAVSVGEMGMNRFMINDYAGECLALLFLAWFSAEDIRDRRLSLTELSGSLLLGMLYLTLTGGLDDGKLPYRMLPGLFLLLLAYLTRWDMGMAWQFLSLAVFWGQGNVQPYVGRPLCCPVFLLQGKYA